MSVGFRARTSAAHSRSSRLPAIGYVPSSLCGIASDKQLSSVNGVVMVPISSSLQFNDKGWRADDMRHTGLEHAEHCKSDVLNWCRYNLATRLVFAACSKLDLPFLASLRSQTELACSSNANMDQMGPEHFCDAGIQTWKSRHETKDKAHDVVPIS